MRYVIISEVTGEGGAFNNKLRKEVFQKLGAKSSKLPAHFTIKAPFEYEGSLEQLEKVLERFTKGEKARPYCMTGYDHFDDRVIYMKVLMSPEGKAMHDRLIEEMGKVPYIEYSSTDGKDKIFHVTISSKRIAPIFQKLWEYVQQYPCDFECNFDNISIYVWKNNTWELYRRYELKE